jgi:hypothetical protein
MADFHNESGGSPGHDCAYAALILQSWDLIEEGSPIGLLIIQWPPLA